MPEALLEESKATYRYARRRAGDRGSWILLPVPDRCEDAEMVLPDVLPKGPQIPIPRRVFGECPLLSLGKA